MPILRPHLTSAPATGQVLDTSHSSLVHEGWPFQDYRHFLLRTGGDQGAIPSEMTRLGNLDTNTICSIRKLFSHLIRATFYQTYKTPCPRHLSSVRDLAFLPKPMGSELHWKEMGLDSLVELLQLTKERFQVLMTHEQSPTHSSRVS